MIDESNIVQLKLRPFHQRFINAYRLYRVFKMPRAMALRGAWTMARVTKPAPMTIGRAIDAALSESIIPSIMRSLQSTLAAHYAVPRQLVVDPTSAEAMGFDAWLAARAEIAHRQFMRRTSCLPAGRDLRPTAEQVEQYHGISIGFID